MDKIGLVTINNRHKTHIKSSSNYSDICFRFAFKRLNVPRRMVVLAIDKDNLLYLVWFADESHTFFRFSAGHKLRSTGFTYSGCDCSNQECKCFWAWNEECGLPSWSLAAIFGSWQNDGLGPTFSFPPTIDQYSIIKYKYIFVYFCFLSLPLPCRFSLRGIFGFAFD